MKLESLESIDQLFVAADNSYTNDSDGRLERISPLASINIFVGANNSGKSRLMRTLAATTPYQVHFSVRKELAEKLPALFSAAKSLYGEYGVQSFGNMNVADFDYILSELSAPKASLREDIYAGAREKVKLWNIQPNSGTSPNAPRGNMQEKLWEVTRPIDQICKEMFERLPVPDPDTEPIRIYIPVLRGLRPIAGSLDDHYLKATKDAFFGTINTSDGTGATFDPKKLEIYTGLSFFNRLRSLRLGKTAERRSVERYEDFLRKTFFDGQAVELVPSESAGVVSIKIGSDSEQPIHYLGDGIQSAIILSFLPYVLRDRPAFFFIEEPEMFMHPGLQRKVLEFFASHPMHRYFLTTHSNHLLDLTADVKSVAVFDFSRNPVEKEADDVTPAFSVTSVNSGCRSSLELLGVRNSSVFLSNCTIWVEGITDRLYLRSMLKNYMALPGHREFEEDVHYSFVEYGGSNIIHWSFLDSEQPQIEVERLCGRAMVIVDDDGATKMERKSEIKKKLGNERFIVLDGREIENMLPYTAIKTVVSRYENDGNLELGNYEFDNYKTRKFGNFIETTMLKKVVRRKGGYAAESGTLKDKLGFCERILPELSFDTLPKETKKVIQRIHKFIASQNEDSKR